jgi:hypothetical protein
MYLLQCFHAQAAHKNIAHAMIFKEKLEPAVGVDMMRIIITP